VLFRILLGVEERPATELYDWDQEAALILATASNVRLNDGDGVIIPEGSYLINYYTSPSAYTDLIYYSIANNPGAALPATGGPGTTFIYILGTMLTGLAGTILALRRKRRAA
jgi:LPXTG-motif cell wall-anchored protein